MRILILGSGGREHAFAYALNKSPLCKGLFVAPGNAGTAQIAENLALDPNDFEAVKAAVLKQSINMVIVGPEAPLVEGIVDFFKLDSALKNVLIIGPDKAAAQLEGSKDFAKEFMQQYGIPTAEYLSVTPKYIEEGLSFLERMQAPYVLKADGLAAGKGVLICDDLAEAKKQLQAMLGGKFGAASRKVVIEEFLQGIELSVFVLTNGKDYKILPAAKDYKRIGEGDTGLNTGGMGAVSPPPFATDEFIKKVEEQIVKPSIFGINQRKMDYCGFLFIGLMKVGDEPKVIEYNVRMGDPETEVVLPRIASDVVELLSSIKTDAWKDTNLEILNETAVTVMMVSEGYPEAYQKGFELHLPKTPPADTLLFHAGTRLKDNKILSAGGRVICATALDNSLQKALAKSYQLVEKVDFEGKKFRRDIGKDLF
ncbi:MAG: phosphoribosylamine--glycine ligase [Flavobacteriaceae bacterium]|nr:phosphoribosylamine--glycine ligase [Flavobacteriaceae bacterium]